MGAWPSAGKGVLRIWEVGGWERNYAYLGLGRRVFGRRSRGRRCRMTWFDFSVGTRSEEKETDQPESKMRKLMR